MDVATPEDPLLTHDEIRYEMRREMRRQIPSEVRQALLLAPLPERDEQPRVSSEATADEPVADWLLRHQGKISQDQTKLLRKISAVYGVEATVGTLLDIDANQFRKRRGVGPQYTTLLRQLRQVIRGVLNAGLRVARTPRASSRQVAVKAADLTFRRAVLDRGTRGLLGKLERATGAEPTVPLILGLGPRDLTRRPGFGRCSAERLQALQPVTWKALGEPVSSARKLPPRGALLRSWVPRPLSPRQIGHLVVEDLEQVVRVMDPTWRRITIGRLGYGEARRSLLELARRHDRTKQAVSQLHQQALKLVRDSLRVHPRALRHQIRQLNQDDLSVLTKALSDEFDDAVDAVAFLESMSEMSRGELHQRVRWT
jgi:hypothetical protein